MDIKEAKKALRGEIRAKRRHIPPETRGAKDKAITEKILSLEEYKKAGTVLCFVSYGGEPETRDIIADILKQDKRLCVPRCLDDGLMEYVVIDSLSCLRAGYKGILEPLEGLPVLEPSDIDMAVVPGLAFTAEGKRLGQGGGFYDRFMENTKAFTCGVCYREFLLEDIPTESFDKKVSAVVTD